MLAFSAHLGHPNQVIGKTNYPLQPASTGSQFQHGLNLSPNLSEIICFLFLKMRLIGLQDHQPEDNTVSHSNVKKQCDVVGYIINMSEQFCLVVPLIIR